MKASITSFGCRLNHSESDVIAGNLGKKGYTITNDDSDAELCVINTCTVTARSDMKCKQRIRSIQRNNPRAKIAVVGCYSQMSSDELLEIGGIDLILGNQEKLNLHHYIDHIDTADGPIIKVDKIGKTPFTIDFSGSYSTCRANLKVQDGCDFFCSFCIIPFSRGRSRPRVLQNILDEAKVLADNGFKEIVLTGVNIGTYLYEGKSFLDVLNALEKVDGIKRIRISSIEPTTVDKAALEYMADETSKVVPFLHLPLQSANNDVLKDMKRRYAFQEYEKFVREADNKVKGLCIGTDVLTGFPTETEAMHQDTLEKLSSLSVNYFHVFPYSERKGTRSAQYPESNSAEVIRRRSLELRELSDKKRQEFYSSYLGKTLSVLFEDKDSENRLRGYSENYIRCVTSDDVRSGDIRSCVVLEVHENYVSVSVLQ